MLSVKHVVPYIVATRKAQRHVQADLQEALVKVRKQLDVACDSAEYTEDQSRCKSREIPLLTYPDELKKRLGKKFFTKYTPIPRFSFNIEDFPISATEMKYASSEFPESRYPIVKNNAPICTNFKEMKGPNSDLYTLAVLRGVTKQKSLHKCKWFTFNYWHSDTYLGKILKSRPGMMVICHNFNIFNNTTIIKGNIPSSMQNTSYPFKFSVYRTKLRKLLRKHFMELYLRDEAFANMFDGFYRFSCTLYPLTESDLEDFINHITICLEKVSKLDLVTMKKAASKEESKIPWHEVKKILSRNNVSPVGIVPPNRRGKKK